MNKKFKQFLTVLAAGVLSVGTAGMLTACGNKEDDKGKEPEIPGQQQPLEPEVVNEVEEFREVTKMVVTAVNNLFNPASDAEQAANLQPQSAFRIYPMAVEQDLNQTLLGYLGAASDKAEDAHGIMQAYMASTMMMLADACAYLVAEQGGTEFYGQTLSMPMPSHEQHQYFRVTKNGQVWKVEEFMTREDGTPVNYYNFEIERDGDSFKMSYYIHGYLDGVLIDGLAGYNYIDSDGNYLSCQDSGYFYGKNLTDGFKVWKIDDTTVQAQCQSAITAQLGGVQPVDLSQEEIAYEFSEEEVEKAEEVIFGHHDED